MPSSALASGGLLEDVLIPFTNAVMEANVETAKTLAPEAGMPEALRDLSSLGVRLACVSNAFMGADVLNRIMEERGLGRHLELTISSCETGIRKPDARIYQAALDAMRTTGPETIFVGDRIDADVEGPSKLGMRTVLTQQYRAEDPTNAPVKPNAVISHARAPRCRRKDDQGSVMSLTRIGHFQAKPDKAEALRAQFESILPHIRLSEGCESAHLLESQEDPPLRGHRGLGLRRSPQSVLQERGPGAGTGNPDNAGRRAIRRVLRGHCQTEEAGKRPASSLKADD